MTLFRINRTEYDLNLKWLHVGLVQVKQVVGRIIRIPVPLPLLSLIIVTGLFLITLIYSLLAYQIHFLDRSHLGIYVNGINVGNQTRSQVSDLVHRQSNYLQQRPITLMDNEASWAFSAAELGARIEAEQTIEYIFSVGKHGHFWADIKEQYVAYRYPINIQPNIVFDSGPANDKLNQIAQTLYQTPRNAKLFIDDQHHIQTIAPKTGQVLNIDATRELIRQSIVSRGQANINLVINKSEPAITQVEPTLSNLKILLREPLHFIFEGRQWTITSEAMADLIILENTIDPNGLGRVTARINPDPLYVYFERMSTEINQDPINAWFDLDQTTGEINTIVSSQNKHRLDVASAVALTIAKLETPEQHTITLPVVIEQPAVPMEARYELGFNELLSSNTSYFKGSSAERMQNIAVSASKFHGLVIPPGEIFSFNEHLGDVTTANGFVESLIIQGDRTAVGIGGGVCQVSTTAFRAAFYGGFEIVERWAHGYRVSWYETHSTLGLDATIYSPTVDLKFRNDTDSHILIQTYTNLYDGTITFNFYGTPTGRSVVVSQPNMKNEIKHGPAIYELDPTLKPGTIKQIDWAKDGVDVTVYRTVFENNDVIHEDAVFSRYLPWRAVYKKGIDLPKPDN